MATNVKLSRYFFLTRIRSLSYTYACSYREIIIISHAENGMKRIRIGWATDRSRALPIIIAHAPLFRLYTLKARVRNNRRLSRGSPRLTFSTGIFHSVIIVGDNSSLAQSVCGFTWNVSIRIIAAKRISRIPMCRTHPWPRVLISCKFPAPIKFESTLCSLGMKMNFPRVFNKRDSICSLFIERTVSCSDEIIYDAIEKRSIYRTKSICIAEES